MIDVIRFFIETHRCTRPFGRFRRRLAMGRSMEPTIPAGSWMTFDMKATPRDGDIVLVKASPMEHLAKLLRWTPYGWLAVSFNEPAMPLDGQEVFGVLTKVERRPKIACIEKLSDRIHREICKHAEVAAWVKQQLRPALDYIKAHAPSGHPYRPIEFNSEALAKARAA